MRTVAALILPGSACASCAAPRVRSEEAGVANFDVRSFLHNNEVNAVIVGSDFARRCSSAI